MRIGVNTRLLLVNKLEGLGRYAHEVLSRLVKLYPQHEFYFFFDREYDPQFVYAPNVTPIVVYPSARHPILYYIWFEWMLPYYFRKLNIERFFSPEGYLSLCSQVPQFHVVHDLAFEHYPKDISLLENWFYRYYYPKYIQKAQKTIAISEFTRQDILKHYLKSEKDNLITIWNGASEVFQPLSNSEQDVVRQKYSSNHPFFLYVGSIHPRKNLSNLLDAFNIFKKKNLYPHKLIIVGKKAWDYEKLLSHHDRSEFRDEIIFTGYLTETELVKVYASCEAVCYVSYFEGFGLPVVEGFRSGVPVIAANSSSLPEVCGDAALLVDPTSPQDIANAMIQIVQNKELKSKLIKLGKHRSQLFSWQNTAESVGEILFSELGA